MTTGTSQLAQEQGYLDVLYGRLDMLRDDVARRLAGVRRLGSVGTPQNRSERDAFATLYEDRLAQLRAVEDRLAFGRLDLTAGDRRYVGRIGLTDEDRRQLLVDWRAPAAQAFYQATAAAPGDVVRRRHLVTRGRSVIGVEDEVLDLDRLGDADRSTLNGEGALLAALNESRTGSMRDIVATIQAEQDRIIRSPLGGVLVVQGGPGTGKTAVALHRAAYLLYTYRDRIARSGVLIVGPNAAFLRYIEQVLPSLGETGVVLTSMNELLPDVTATGVDEDRVAALKGDRRMAKVIANAVRDRQRVPRKPLRLEVDNVRIAIQPRVIAGARHRARQRRKPHNAVRPGFLLELLDHAAQLLARATGTELTEDSRPDLIGDLRDSPSVRRELNLLWMPLTPRQLLADLYADPERLASAAPFLTAAERELLHRPRGSEWTTADVPLLDEAAELLGEDDSAASTVARQQAEQRRQDLEYARGALQLRGGGDFPRVTAEMLADRFADSGSSMTVAERAVHDRTWTYGHVVVDEAQELSPMAWRALMRRCPSRSMTVVGDLAQTGAAAGVHAWADVLDPYAEGRWRVEQLTVNYRTPRQIMEVASAVLAAGGVVTEAPESARSVPWSPVVDWAADLPPAVVAGVRAELEDLGNGRLAVITPRAQVAALRALLGGELPEGTVGRTALTAPVSVLTVADAKGLEVDTVVLVEPAAVVAESPRGVNDLYVALTRPTQRLRVVHTAPLPPGMGSLTGR